MRGLAGLFGAYDFNSEEGTRHAALGLGPGATAELRLRARGYLQGSLVGYLVPWGAAGGIGEGQDLERVYHRGPGLAALAELKLGQRGLGEVSVTSRLYRIQAVLAGDDANETVLVTTAGARLNLARHHAVGLELDHHYRRASYWEGPRAGELDRAETTEIRVFYAVTSDVFW